MREGDNSTKQSDVKWRHAGPGMSQQFRCAKCQLPSSMLGRKLQQVKGLRDWVCRKCAT